MPDRDRSPIAGAGRGLEKLLPRSLLGRSILIIVTPVVLLQIVSAWVFYDSHWNTVTRRLAQSVAGDIATIIRLLPRPFAEDKAAPIFAIGSREMGLDLSFNSDQILPNDPTIMRQNLVDRQLSRALVESIGRPFLIDSRSLEKSIEIHVQLAEGVLHVVVARRRLFSSTTYVFLLWMAGTSLVLLTAATLFMRGQVKPIRRLAQAAEDFGRGQDGGDFAPTGATEVAMAGHAFNQMRDRIRRQIAQRTEMLAGVSHDLRTPLTRMKLQIAIMAEASAKKADHAAEAYGDLLKDIADMERMIGAYLAFAKGEGAEQPRPTDLSAWLGEAIADARREGARIALRETQDAADIVLMLRPDACRRALMNVLGNAHRYGGNIEIALRRHRRQIEILIDDDGPGIPEDQREAVFKPFFRLDPSRNPETGGTGLGLTIARDILRSHGGDLTLAESPQGGTRAILTLPL